MKRVILISMILALFILPLPPHTGVRGQAQGGKLVFGVLPIVDSLPIFVAEEEGLFRREGIDVEVVNFASALERDSALQGGKLDGFLGDVVATLLLIDRGFKVRIVATSLGATPGEGVFAILAPPGSPIKTADDLRGRSIAISSDTVIEYVTDRLIGAGNYKKLEIKKIPIRFQMLMSGQVDAATLPDPLASLAVFQGAKLIIDDTAENISQSVLAFNFDRHSVTESNLKAFMRAYAEAVRIVNANPDSHRELLVRRASLPEPIKDIYKVDHFSVAVPTAEDIKGVSDWLLEKGLIKRGYSYGDAVDPRFLP
ncbi:MAG: MetQ/NlpA family ABC transporter substrate-binding protein [bacterium]